MESETFLDINAEMSIKEGDIVYNHTDKQYSVVTSVDDALTLSIKPVNWFVNTWLRFKVWLPKQKKPVIRILIILLLSIASFTAVDFVKNNEYIKDHVHCESGELFINCDIKIKEKL